MDYATKLNMIYDKVYDHGRVYNKLLREFYVICLLNALFGNPNVHLVHLHQRDADIKGFRNYDKANVKYALNSKFEDANTFKMERKRRNAVAEVIRFICWMETGKSRNIVGTSLKDEVYIDAYSRVLNGDI